jgi:hypothetical protein
MREKMSSTVTLQTSVIMRKRLIQQGPWQVPSWEVLGVVPFDPATGIQRGKLVRDDGQSQHFIWSGFPLRLYRDGAENYWYNLSGDNPALYVLCHEDPDGNVEPFSVTANHDEASAGIEGDDRVYATAMPAEIYLQLEKFVVEHFKPREKKVRKRKNWSGDNPA